jgi:hypothetical protein
MDVLSTYCTIVISAHAGFQCSLLFYSDMEMKCQAVNPIPIQLQYHSSVIGAISNKVE